MGAGDVKKDNRTMPPEENKKRMQLYKQGLNDREIGERCGVAKGTIQCWRNKWGLMPNRRYSTKKVLGNQGRPRAHLSKVLTSAEQTAMMKFLALLIRANEMKPGLDIAEFMKAYRDTELADTAYGG